MSRPISRRALCLLASLTCLPLALGCSKPAPAEGGEVKVAAAASLAIAFKEVGAEFERRTGKKVTFSFGSSGNLAKQIENGAPFDVFAAANVGFVDAVIKAGACDGATKEPYARGRIVLWVKDGAGAPPKELSALTDARYAKIAIANAEHAPYGRAAREALISAGVWEAVQPRLVFGENVQQTLQFAQSGNAEVAIVALSLGMSAQGGTYTLVDDTLHKPLDQALVVCTRGADAKGGAAFTELVNSKDGRAIMRKFGFLLPHETVASTP